MTSLVGAATPDVEIEIVLLVFVFLEEDIGIVVADVLDVFDILDIGDFFLGSGFLGVGVLERDDLGTRLLDQFLDLDLLFFLLIALGDAGAHAPLLEIGARIRLARVRGNDRILVQVVKLLARVGVFSFGTAVVCQF